MPPPGGWPRGLPLRLRGPAVPGTFRRPGTLVHQATAKLVPGHSLIVTEDLSIKNMTASAKGTAEKPGKKVKQKAGLNRTILDTAPGSFINNLLVKAEEAGRCQVMLLNNRKHRPSQTCPDAELFARKSWTNASIIAGVVSQQRGIKPPPFRCSWTD